MLKETGKIYKQRRMDVSKTIGRKICGLVAVIGVVMILMVVLNIAALGVLKGYSAEVKDNVVTLETAVQSGDAGGT